MHTFVIAACAGLAAAHGQIKEFVVDGNTYPAFDPQLDYDPKWNAKRIEYGFAKGKSGNGPVEDVRGKDITCRYAPVKTPEIEAEARAGATVSFKWLDWFQSHKGPVLTYMAPVPASGDPADAEFFKIDEATYDPKTMTWGSDWLMKNNGVREVTIPSDIQPGPYIIRHEIISLHNALNDDYIKKSSGAQFYPQCIRVNVTGDGTAKPPGVKFPGGYTWDEKGILVNIFYRANEYTSPGPILYKPATVTPPKGEKPVSGDVKPTEAYMQAKNRSDKMWQGAVHSTDAKHPGGGGCIWDPNADPKTAKCTSLNTANPEYKGFAQPPQSPGYVDQAHMDRSIVKYGPIIKYLFDPTQPRMEERVKSGAVTVAAAPAPKGSKDGAPGKVGMVFGA